MNPKYFLSILAAVLLAATAQAQYTDNFQTNTISGVVSNWAGDYFVGANFSDDILLIQAGGVFSNGFAYVGYQFGANNNTVLVTGPGSAWSNANDLSVGYLGALNSMTITNGGTVYNGNGYIGNQADADDNAVLVTGSGSVWNNTNQLNVGYYGAENSLTIASSGTVYNAAGFIGVQSGANNNTVLVTGSGSVWSNATSLLVGGSPFLGGIASGNSLTISNGGSVYNGGVFESNSGQIGGRGNDNAVLVTGSGSVWTDTSDLLVGENGSGNSLTIADGGTVFVGGFGAILSSSNAVLVTGSGSVWSNANFLSVGYGNSGSGNSLTIADAGKVFVSGIVVIASSSSAVLVTGSGSVWNAAGELDVGGGPYGSGAGNSLTISNGGYVVCGAALVVSQAGGTDSLILNGGSVTANQLVLTNGANSVFTFNAGLLTSSGTSVTNSQLFVVGDGTDAATFHLNGGIHSFANNLEISNNATLSGCGTIEGNVTIDPGGTVIADCGGTLTFTGIVTNNGTVLAVNGTVLQVDGQVVNNGVINAINGTTQFLGGLVNNGCVLTETNVQISSITRSGANISVQIPSAACGTYQLQVTPSLKPATWTNLSASQDGTGGVLTFTDTGGATNRPGRFYRIDVTLP